MIQNNLRLYMQEIYLKNIVLQRVIDLIVQVREGQSVRIL
jgi:hypothetical protein